eukprot:g5730.t1
MGAVYLVAVALVGTLATAVERPVCAIVFDSVYAWCDKKPVAHWGNGRENNQQSELYKCNRAGQVLKRWGRCTETATLPTCRKVDGTVHAMCNGLKMHRWGIGPEGAAQALKNCNWAARTKRRPGTGTGACCAIPKLGADRWWHQPAHATFTDNWVENCCNAKCWLKYGMARDAERLQYKACRAGCQEIDDGKTAPRTGALAKCAAFTSRHSSEYAACADGCGNLRKFCEDEYAMERCMTWKWKKLKGEIFDHAMAIGFVAVHVRPNEVPSVVPWGMYRPTVTVDKNFKTVIRAYPTRAEDGAFDQPLRNVVVLDMFGYSPTARGVLNSLRT